MNEEITADNRLHERVLEDSAGSYLKVTNPESILINHRGKDKYDINGKYPDIIVKMPTGEIVIEKIETELTVDKFQISKWQEFARLGHQFKLVVPLSKLEEARALTLSIPNVNLQAYEVVGDQVQWFGRN